MSFSAAETVSGSSGGRPGVRPRFLAAAMPSRVCPEMSRRSKCAMEPEDVEHEFAGRGRGVEALFEADQMYAVGLEIVDGFEQFPEAPPIGRNTGSSCLSIRSPATYSSARYLTARGPSGWTISNSSWTTCRSPRCRISRAR